MKEQSALLDFDGTWRNRSRRVAPAPLKIKVPKFLFKENYAFSK